MLPAPEPFVDGHLGLDAAVTDADGVGLLDLLVVGTQLNPFYDGWFVQLLMNQGGRTFTDETASRSSRTSGSAAALARPRAVRGRHGWRSWTSTATAHRTSRCSRAASCHRASRSSG